jgi:hypothetical protein
MHASSSCCTGRSRWKATGVQEHSHAECGTALQEQGQWQQPPNTTKSAAPWSLTGG